MYLSKIIGIILILLSIVFLGLQALNEEFYAFGVKALAMCLLVVFYCIKVKKKNILFFLFLVFYAVAETYNYLTFNIHVSDHMSYDVHYLVCNAFYGLAYLFLIFRILSLMNFKKAVLMFPLQIMLLFGLGIFVVYMITDLPEIEVMLDHEHKVEIIYNAVIMFLVCLALINYMYNDNKKSMNLLVGCIFIIFAEIFQIAYYYIANYNIAINVTYSFFLVVAFVFFNCQSKILHEYKSDYDGNQGLKI